MMRIRKLLMTVLISLLLTPFAFASEGSILIKDRSYDEAYSSKENRLKFKKKYGYYPYFFSDKSRKRYSSTPAEKGHYILGLTQEELTRRQIEEIRNP
jgi:hypothetical protein